MTSKFFRRTMAAQSHAGRKYFKVRVSNVRVFLEAESAPEYHPPLRTGKAQRKSARVIRVLRVSTWESASGCEHGVRSRTPKHVAVGAIPELRAPIFAGFFHVRGG